MGIKRFAAWLESNYGSVVTTRELPKNVNSLLLDANALVHNVAQKVFSYGDRYEGKRSQVEGLSSTEQIAKLCSEVCEEIVRLIKLIKPANYLVIAFDGVAPFAKITQQRKRRYKGAMGKKYDEGARWTWNSDAISPGTEFMITLDETIQQWLGDNKLLPKTVIYSSHLDPGEGEHKIMSYIRDGLIEPGEYAGPNVLVGLDADLTILSMLAPINHIYLYKENWNKNRRIETTTIVNIEMFKSTINSIFAYRREPELPTMTDQIRQSCRDFAVIVQLIGNDFLPTMIELHNPDNAFAYLFAKYSKIRKPLTEEDGQIIWTNFTDLLKLVADDETELLLDIHRMDLTYPYKPLKESVAVVPSTETRERTFALDFEMFRSRWYDSILSPNTDEGLELIALLEREEEYKDLIDPFIDNDDINEISLLYSFGMQWVLRYYMTGHAGVSSEFIYRYKQAPLVSDLVYFLETSEGLPTCEEVKNRSKEIRLNAIQQLLAILPPASRELLPVEYRHLLTIELVDIAPEKFKIYLEGASADWEASPILPPIEPLQIVRAFKTVSAGRLNKRYKEKDKIMFMRQQEIRIPYIPTSFDAYARSQEPGFSDRGGRGGRGRGGFADRGGRGRGGFSDRGGRGGRGGFSPRGGFSDRGGRGRGRGGKYIPVNRKWSERRDLFEDWRS